MLRKLLIAVAIIVVVIINVPYVYEEYNEDNLIVQNTTGWYVLIEWMFLTFGCDCFFESGIGIFVGYRLRSGFWTIYHEITLIRIILTVFNINETLDFTTPQYA